MTGLIAVFLKPHKLLRIIFVPVLLISTCLLPVSGQSIDSPIHLYYGDKQVFGHCGIQQPIVNITGRVSQHQKLYALSYRFNKTRQPLLTGPTAFRLSEPGEFNIEIDRNNLVPGEYNLGLIAIYKDGNIYRKNVSFTLLERSKELPLVIDFKNLNSIQKSIQVVDGEWEITQDGIRTKTIGYDRSIAIGDSSWSDYEVEIEFIIHSLSEDPLIQEWPSMGAAMHVAVYWQGHEDWKDIYPRRGWSNFGALFSYESRGDENRKLVWIYDQVERKSNKTDLQYEIRCGDSYKLRAQVISLSLHTSEYRMKLWNAEESEPVSWEIETTGQPGENRSGSVLLVAHQADITFKSVRISSIE